MDDYANILFSHYSGNQGSPLKAAANILKKLYEQLPADAYIAGACVTGYGEALIKEALSLDYGEVETIAHYRAAAYFNPNVDFIIDIGGQDMKALHIRDGVIETSCSMRPALRDAAVFSKPLPIHWVWRSSLLLPRRKPRPIR